MCRFLRYGGITISEGQGYGSVEIGFVEGASWVMDYESIKQEFLPKNWIAV